MVAKSSVFYIDIEPVLPDSNIDAKTKRIATASGCSVQVVSYRDLIKNKSSIASLRAESVLAWFISGSFAEWSDYPQNDLDDLKDFLLIATGTMPVLGVCAGHQLIAMAHGAKVAHMSCFDATKSPPDGACPEAFASSPNGWKTKEITLKNSNDQIFWGLPNKRFNFSHHDEVTAVPSGFENLAETTPCAIQVLKHKEKLIYTTQFHPEMQVPGQLDGGEKLMRNFFAQARQVSLP